MKCYGGICRYKTDNGYCEKDLFYLDSGTMKLCDMVEEDYHIHKCKYGYVSCYQCFRYWCCEET